MSKTVLCADDSATMQTVAEITFRATDYSYVGARSVDDAIAKAKEEKPAVILADALMGDKSGYDLCKAIKSEPSLSDVPVIVMCGNSEAYDEAKGSEAGADGHVTKPWDTQKLLDQLNEIVDRVSSGAPAKPADAVAAAPAVSAPPAPAAKPAEPAEKPAAAKPTTPAIPNLPAASSSQAQPPRSPTLMGMPSLQMPPGGGRQTPAGVTPITPPSQSAKPAAPAPSKPAPAATAKPAVPSDGARAPMISGSPSKPIRLVLASQAESAATQAAQGAGLSGGQAEALTQVSREVLEQVVWEVVPQLAEAIIRENLETLTSKAR